MFRFTCARHYRNYLSSGRDTRTMTLAEKLRQLERCVWKFEGAGLRTLPQLSRLEILDKENFLPKDG